MIGVIWGTNEISYLVGLFTHISIINTSFSLIQYKRIIYLVNTKLYLQGSVIFENNVCTTSVIELDRTTVVFTDNTEFTANKGNTIFQQEF